MAERLKKLGISSARFAKMVGISQPAMRLIVLGANQPRPETAQKIDAVLKHVDFCPTCGRAFLEDDDDADRDAQTKTTKGAKGRG